jgi:DNA-binding IclR family transcriptional regulator
LSEPVRAVERALDVLLCFSRRTPELTMTQIAEQIGIHKSTVHRLLATLEKRRFVERDSATGVYRLGIRLLQMAYLTLEQNDLRRMATPFLQRLWEEHRETVHLAVLDDVDVVFVDVIESPQRVKLAAAIGERLPAFATASGKAILACLPDPAVHKILQNGMPRHTPRTLCLPEALFEDLRLVRERGFAVDEQELEDGINAVASAILDSSGQPIAAVAIAGPAYRLAQERLLQIGPSISATARDITREMSMAVQPQEDMAEEMPAHAGNGEIISQLETYHSR